MSQASGARVVHTSSSSSKPGIDLAAVLLQRPGCHQVDPDVLRAEVAGQVARGRLEGGLGHAHPVVLRPGQRRVEGEADHRAAVGHQRLRGDGQRLERVRRDLQRGRDVGPLGVEEVAAQRSLGGEADRVQDAVEPVDVLAHPVGSAAKSSALVASSSITGGVVGSRFAMVCGDPHGAAERGEHQLGALLLGDPRDVERDGGVHQHTGHEDALAVEDVPS